MHYKFYKFLFVYQIFKLRTSPLGQLHEYIYRRRQADMSDFLHIDCLSHTPANTTKLSQGTLGIVPTALSHYPLHRAVSKK